MNRIAQGQRSIKRTDNTLIIDENWLPIKVESVKLLPGRFRSPTFQAHTKIALEEIFDLDSADPVMIRLKVTVFLPVICQKYDGPPQTLFMYLVPLHLDVTCNHLD